MSTQYHPTARSSDSFTKEEWRQLVINGKTTAGPLAVLMYKYPKAFIATGMTILTVISVSFGLLL